MTQFEVGQSKTARVRMKNPTGKAFDYSGSIYFSLLPVSEKLFLLGAGEEKDVLFPVVIPDRVGTHPVHIGVFSEQTPLALYQALEDATISPAGIDLNTLKILSVDGQSFSQVGHEYGELASPLIRPSLSGMGITWQNTGIVPISYHFAHDEYERWDWWMSFEPQFDTRIWQEPEEEGQEGDWWEPPMPTYMKLDTYTPTSFPPIGGPYTVNINGLHSGGWTTLPGLYDGIFFLQRVYMGYDVAPRIYWRIKNLVEVTG